MLPPDLKEHITISPNKVRIESKRFISFILDVLHDIISRICDLIYSLPTMIDAILLVGGISDCVVLRQEAKKAFKGEITVIIPSDAILSVAKGAVLFGFEPESIAERIARFTYGIGQTVTFDKNIHPTGGKVKMRGKTFVDGVFDIHVRVSD